MMMKATSFSMTLTSQCYFIQISLYQGLILYSIFKRYIVSELCTCTLNQLIRKNSDPATIPYDKNEILWQISSGLEYLHEKLICHRDLNPSSVLLSRPDGTLQPRIKLTNFAFIRVSKQALPLYKLVKRKEWLPPEVIQPKIYLIET